MTDITLTETNHLRVDYTAENFGDLVYDSDGTDGDVALVHGGTQEDSDSVRVPPDASVDGTLFWRAVPAGSYQVCVETDDGQDCIDVEVASAPFFNVTITDAPDTVDSGDLVSVDYEVENTGGEQGTQDTVLLVDGTEEDRDVDVTVASGGTAAGTLEWQTASDDDGDFNVVVESDDDSDSETVTVTVIGVPLENDLRSQYDATNDATITQSNGTVTGWDDKVGTNDLTGATTGLSDINGVQAINFDGSNDSLSVGSWDSDLPQPVTVAVVYQFDSFNSADVETVVTGRDSLGDCYDIRNQNGDKTIFSGSMLTGPSMDTDAHSAVTVFDGGASIFELEDSQVASGDAGTREQDGGADFSVGARQPNDDFRADVTVGEVLVYERKLSNTERSDVHSYFSDKWGISI
jgi:hypothetical protein